MRNRITFLLAVLGVLMAIASAIFYGRKQTTQPPKFSPATNPYAHGIYANGIVESFQGSGENINIYPDVSGRITQIMVHEGDHVAAGQPLLMIDNSVQRALAEQQKHQGEAALASLQALQAQPRRETLAVAAAFLDSGANVSMLLALQASMLSLASVLMALYPAATVLLAIVVLRERVTRWQGVGMVLALAAVGMISVR